MGDAGHLERAREVPERHAVRQVVPRREVLIDTAQHTVIDHRVRVCEGLPRQLRGLCELRLRLALVLVRGEI